MAFDNEEHANAACEAIVAYANKKDVDLCEESVGTVVRDLLADLMHYADYEKMQPFIFEEELRIARDNYHAERGNFDSQDTVKEVSNEG